ncbi:MAG: phytanoyl-CoA dioxygenase family protein [Planctomycetota bacterium]|nr:phytanoyl-CoA dioxygenase family protein [Planctomycetota bacterium]
MGCSPIQQRELDEVGFLVLPDFMSPDLLDRLRERVDALLTLEGDRAGSEFKQEPGCCRLANLIEKGTVFRELLLEPRMLDLVSCVLGRKFKLSSMNARSANPHGNRRQPLHCDMNAVPDEAGFWVCNTVWMLDDFTDQNGPIRAVPGSHRSGQLPQETFPDLSAPHPQEVLLTGSAGTVIIMNAHLWHGGIENQTAYPRRAVHGFFCRRDKPQQQYQRRLLSAETQAMLTLPMRRLLALDDALNDELSADVPVRSGFLK